MWAGGRLSSRRSAAVTSAGRSSITQWPVPGSRVSSAAGTVSASSVAIDGLRYGSERPQTTAVGQVTAARPRRRSARGGVR